MAKVKNDPFQLNNIYFVYGMQKAFPITIDFHASPTSPNVCEFYEKFKSGLRGYDIRGKNLLYKWAVLKCIKANNIEGLNILWDYMYTHTSECPSFADDIKNACKYSSLKMVTHVLYSAYTKDVSDIVEPDFDALKQSTSLDEVRDYLTKFEPFMTHLEASFSKRDEESVDDWILRTDDLSFAEAISTFNKQV